MDLIRAIKSTSTAKNRYEEIIGGDADLDYLGREI